MIALWFLLLQDQQRPPTVGDTLWATRFVRLAPGDSVRAAQWELDGAVQLLGRPEVRLENGGAEVRYPLVAWEAGNHQVDMPGPIVTRASGVEDTLQTLAMTFQVATVLPAGVADSELAVQPPAVPVLRGFRTILPAAILGGLALLLLVPLHWWWNRRGPRVSPPARPFSEGTPEDLVRRWADAGERRTVAGVASLRLREVIAQAIPSAHAALDTASVLAVIERHHPAWPMEELKATLDALDGLRFAPSRADNAFELYQRSARLAEQIKGRAA
jgi:hypothetical protein